MNEQQYTKMLNEGNACSSYFHFGFHIIFFDYEVRGVFSFFNGRFFQRNISNLRACKKKKVLYESSTHRNGIKVYEKWKYTHRRSPDDDDDAEIEQEIYDSRALYTFAYIGRGFFGN